MKPIQYFAHWEQVRSDLILTIDKFSEEELFFTPFSSSWPVGKIALHIANCEAHWLHDIVMHKHDPQLSWEFSNHSSKLELIDVLNRTHEKTMPFLNSLNEKDLKVIYTTPHQETFSLYWMIWHVIEHEIHHRGELSLILGLLGREGLDV